MRRSSKLMLSVLLVGFFAAQLAHTVMDENQWPLCSYNMFNFVPELRSQVMRFVLVEEGGRRQEVEPGQVLPIEFFRATSLCYEVYLVPEWRDRREVFSRQLLDRLNAAPWHAFDETYAAARPRKGGRFIGLRVVARTEEYDEFPLRRPQGEVSRIYSFRSPF